MQHVPESDYSVTVGDQPCTELDVSDDGTALTCLPPQEPSLAGLHSSVVTVSNLCDSDSCVVCSTLHDNLSNPVTYGTCHNKLYEI